MNPNPNDPKESEDRKRMMMAVLLSLLILFGFQFFFEKPHPRLEQALQQAADKTLSSLATAVKKNTAAPAPVRIAIKGQKITGSLSLTGARIDDVILNDYYTETAGKEPVKLLIPSGNEGAFYVESGWLADKKDLALPGPDTVWQLSPAGADKIVGGGDPVILQWNNGQGFLFEREVSLDDNYLFTIKQRIINQTGTAQNFNAYHLAARQGRPHDFKGFYVLHEGPVAFLGKERHEPSYSGLADGDKIELTATKGWLGLTDKYWLAAVLPSPDQVFNARIIGSKDNKGEEHFQTDAVFASKTVVPGQTLEETSYIYAGVKDLKLMQSYERLYGFEKLELGIDFGMWYFITKPFFFLLHFLISFTGSVAVAILLMTVIIRAAVFPLASKSFRSMAKMKIVAPKLKELQEMHKDDKVRLQQEIYDLYRKENVNPFSGCWPLLIQIPIFFALYKVILISVELRHAPFWGWISDLSAPDPTTIFNLFGLIPWTPPAVFMIGAWPCLFCISMILQMRLSPPAADPIQDRIQAYFPYIVTVMMAQFSAGLVIYWTWSNILGVVQQYYILNRLGGEKTSILRGHSARRKKNKDS